MSKIKLAFSNFYDAFSTSRYYHNLKKISFLRRLKVKSAHIIWRFFPAKYQLHNDPILQKSFQMAVESVRATSIVETGTFMGYSTELMSKMFPNIPIYTCEINPNNFSKARKNLSKMKNVKIFLGTSPELLNKFLDENMLGERPVFFLDAHWLDEWPLEEEIKIIGNRVSDAVIFIDDFKIPGRTADFVYDKYGPKECSIEMIGPKMNKKRKYYMLLPAYGKDIFNPKEYHPVLSGYPIIFQNLKKEFKDFSDSQFIKKYFTNSTHLLDKYLK